ncbi:MAG: fibronectin type III domain-containing protein [bacterium]
MHQGRGSSEKPGRSFPRVLFFVVSIMAVGHFGFHRPAAALPGEATLVWSPAPEQDVAAYQIHIGPVSRYSQAFTGYADTIQVPEDACVRSGNVLRYRLTGLDPAAVYWVSVTAVDQAGNESSFSNEKRIPSEDAQVGPVSPGCRSMPGLSGDGLRASLTGWIVLLASVPLWVLRLRKVSARRIRCRT